MQDKSCPNAIKNGCSGLITIASLEIPVFPDILSMHSTIQTAFLMAVSDNLKRFGLSAPGRPLLIYEQY
jgi:hypothetical protein